MEDTKKCYRCEIIKPISLFRKNKRCLDGLTYYCKSCFNQAYQQQARLRYKLHQEHYIQLSKNWNQSNPEKRREASRRACKKPIVKIRKRLRNRIKKVLGYNSISRNEAIGCSSQELKKHFENQFQKGMSWENYGTIWHVDHIRPLASFNLREISEQKLANHFTNLQPLFAEDNLTKGAKYLPISPLLL